MVAATRAALVAAMMAASTPAEAQTQISISMAAPPATPRILSPAVAGIVPRTPFLHTISASGQRPMTFTASGLPAGLVLDGSTGRITGTVDMPGQYIVTLAATNAVGSATATFTIAAGDTLALTPPVGWNSYDSFDDSVTEAEFLAQAQWEADHLLPFGWQYAVVDFRWYDPGAPASNQNQAGINMNLVMDANGRFQPDPVRFPSSAAAVGFRALADRVHAMGLKFGIHIMRGIPRRAYQANSPILGSTFTATNAADTADTCPWNSDMYGVRVDTDAGSSAGQAWYDSIFQQYAAWEIDFVKVDDMVRNNVNPGIYHQAEVQAISSAIAKSGRSIVLSLSPGEMPVANAAHLGAHANMWRMSNDFWDRPADLDHIFTLANSWQGAGGPGHWPDADMLPLGSLSPRCPVDGNHTTRFTHNEQVSMMSLWAILPSPLMLGANMTALDNDAWTTALITNEEVLAVNQDPLGQRATRVSQQGLLEVWARGLRGGSKAVALLNRGATDQMMSVTWAALGITGMPRVRDVWRRSDFAATTGGISTLVPFRGAILFVVTPEVIDGGNGPDGAAPEGGSPDVDDANRDSPSEAADARPVDAATSEPRPSDASTVDSPSDVSMVDSPSDAATADSVVDDSTTTRDVSGPEAGPFDAGNSAPNDSSGCSCSLGSRVASGAGPEALLAIATGLGAARRRRRAMARQARAALRARK